MQRDITDYLEEIMNSGLSKEEKEVLMSALSKKLLQEKERENEQKETALKESEVEDDKTMETDSFKEESFSNREIVSDNGVKQNEENMEYSYFDTIDFCKRNNVEPMELGRIMMTPYYLGLSKKQAEIVVKYLNDSNVNKGIKEYVINHKREVGEYFDIGADYVDSVFDDILIRLGTIDKSDLDSMESVEFEMARYYMIFAATRKPNTEFFPENFMFGVKRSIGRDITDFECLKLSLPRLSGESRIYHSNYRGVPIGCVRRFEDFGIKFCSEENSTEEEIHTVGNFLEFCEKNDIPRFEVSKIMFAPSYKCLDDEELNIVDKLLPVAKQINDVSRFSFSLLSEASNIVNLKDFGGEKTIRCPNIKKILNCTELENAVSFGRECDGKRLCFDTMRMMLSKTFLENYDSLVSDDIRNAISKVSPMKTICDYGSFMDKMKAMYGYRKSLEERTMTSSDKEKLYNETIPNMNAVIDKFDDYEFGYSASSSSSIGAR